MRLISDDVDIDLVDANERAQRYQLVVDGMRAGLITADNFDWEDRNAVRAFFVRLPIIQAVDPRRGLAKIIGETSLVEGRDWCFATSRDGMFGVFSLDEPSRTFLNSATLHLWIGETISDPRTGYREDFTDLPSYYDVALEASLAA